MMFDFDEIIDRNNTNTYKQGLRNTVFGRSDVLPLWVADMDFKVAPQITEALQKRVSHGIFGYTLKPDSLYESMMSWYEQRQGWHITKESVLFYHGVVPSVNLAIWAFTNPGDSIIVQPPVYFPLFQSVENNGREVIYNQLVKQGKSYVVDFDHLETSVTSRTKLFFLCHPHNPVGKVWAKAELEKLSTFCQKHGIIMVSDEIHSDIMINGGVHVPWNTLGNYARNNSFVTVAPSKTFNIAGLSMSAIVVENPILRKKIESLIAKWQLHQVSLLSLTAFEAAYAYGEDWLEAVLLYLQDNYNYIKNFCEKKMTDAVLFDSQATFLAWLDLSAYGNHDDVKNAIITTAKVGLSDGLSFGAGGQGFQRMNFATPKAVLVKALDSIYKALHK